jgi:bifunctional non-homologous end joining protein LigD
LRILEIVGYSLQLFDDAKAHVVSRKRNSLDERFPELAEIGKAIKDHTALIDGEIVALGADGLPRFDALRSRRRRCSVVLYAFDLLYLHGFDLTRCPLVKRKALLNRILPKENTGRIRSRITSSAMASGYSRKLRS